jgi:hypothetical protein
MSHCSRYDKYLTRATVQQHETEFNLLDCFYCIPHHMKFNKISSIGKEIFRQAGNTKLPIILVLHTL